MAQVPASGLQLRSLVKENGELELSLASVPTPEPAADEVLVRIEAAPINPSDLGLLLGAADLSTAKQAGTADSPVVKAQVPERLMRMMAARIGQSMPVGNEGAGVVVKAGASPEAQKLVGRLVGLWGGATYAQYKVVKAADVLPLPDGASAADGASCFVNPLTALGMVETMKREGHKALVHTAAASNLGQMLVKICLKDGVGLVNIVRSEDQVKTLKAIGAKHVLNSTAPGFVEELTAALKETGATLAFDAIGGGKLANQILTAMEIAQSAGAAYSRYGSAVHKQVYIYGGLDMGPTELTRGFGMSWGVGGWLLPIFLARAGQETAMRLRARVGAELKTTFASHYSKVISLRDALKVETIAAYNKKATGEKYLINPAM